jgi:hypothetical protein
MQNMRAERAGNGGINRMSASEAAGEAGTRKSMTADMHADATGRQTRMNSAEQAVTAASAIMTARNAGRGGKKRKNHGAATAAAEDLPRKSTCRDARAAMAVGRKKMKNIAAEIHENQDTRAQDTLAGPEEGRVRCGSHAASRNRVKRKKREHGADAREAVTADSSRFGLPMNRTRPLAKCAALGGLAHPDNFALAE